jgi:hypothetical protein
MDKSFIVLVGVALVMLISYLMSGCESHKCGSCPSWPDHGPCPVDPDNCCHK